MAVSISEYNEVVRKYNALHKRWNELIDKLNAKGGQEFIDEGVLPCELPQLTQEDIRRLILLVHPDKHEGKPMAVELTQKLLKMRGAR